MKINLLESIVVAAFAAVVTLLYVILAALLGWHRGLPESDYGQLVIYAVFAGTMILTWIVWRILRHALLPLVERRKLRTAEQNAVADAQSWRRFHRKLAKLNLA